MKKFLSLVIAICFSSSVYAAPIQQKGVSNKQKTTIDFNELVNDLSMTDNQREELKNLLKESSSKKTALKQEIKVKADAIDAELLKENYDSALVDSLTKDIQSLTSEYSTINIESKNKIRNILDYNQYTQYTQMEQDNTQVIVEKAKSPEVLAQEEKTKKEQERLEKKARAEQLKAEEKAKKEQAKLEAGQLKAEEKAKVEQEKLEKKAQAKQLKAEEKAKKEQNKLEKGKAKKKAKKEQEKAKEIKEEVIEKVEGQNIN